MKWSSGIYYTPHLSRPTKVLALENFRISKDMLQTIVHMSAQLSQQLNIENCNIETKNLEFNSEIKFTLPWICFCNCYGYDGETSGLNKELEDIIKAIASSKLKASLTKFWFKDYDSSITEEDVKCALESKGLNEVVLEKE